MKHLTTIDQIKELLNTAFSPELCEIEDESFRHSGHVGQKEGGHFILRLVSKQFAGQSLLERQRRVYEILDLLFKEKKIHALKMRISECL